MNLKDLKIGQVVEFRSGPWCFRSKTYTREGEVVFLPHEGTIPHTTSLILRAKGGWKDNHLIPESLDSLISNRLRVDDEYGGWFVSPENIEKIISEPHTIIKMTTKAKGGFCKICNDFNEYQSGPYTCYRHTH